jgi:RimJ/RimL family protein N-acetyltransferase
MHQTPDLPRPALTDETIRGRTIDLELANLLAHGDDLWRSIGSHDELWGGIPSGPFATEVEFLDWLAARVERDDQRAYAIIDKTDGGREAVGLFFLLQVRPDMGTCELGLVYGPSLMRTIAGTEAVFRLIQYVMEAGGYRRIEWRCGPDNLASVRAASRYGFTYEGTMRQTYWLKGHNWDTRIYSILDSEWPAIGARFEAWLAPGNFDGEGQQIRALSEL